MTSELLWIISKCVTTNEYPECITKKFSGRLPYRMVMDAILKNEWTDKNEGGQGKSAYWSAYKQEMPSREYSIHYNCATSYVTFTITEAK